MSEYPPAPPEVEGRLMEELSLEEGDDGAQVCHPLPHEEDEE